MGMVYEAYSQQIIINTTGEKLVMFADGSWRATEEGDSILLRQYYQKTMTTAKTQGISRDTNVPATSQEYILKQWNEFYFAIRAQEKKVLNEFRTATNAQFRASELLDNAMDNKRMIEPDHYARLHDDYDNSIRDLKRAKQNYKTIQQINEEAKQIASLPLNKLEPRMEKLMAKYRNYLSSFEQMHGSKFGSTSSSKSKTKVSEKKKASGAKSEKTGASINIAAATVPLHLHYTSYRAEPFLCRFTLDTIDQTSGRRRVEMAPDLIFTHTDPDLRPYFKDKDLITCYGKFSRIDAYVYLTIDFQIASSHSQSNFGSLESGSLLRLKLLNGEYVALSNLKSDRGRIDPYSGHTIFTGQYALGKNEINLLMDSGLDKIRILWSTGYEDYDIYKVNFFIDHLQCLTGR